MDYCSWREGQVHDIGDIAPWIPISAYTRITVGTEEHDYWSVNDSTSASLTANDWYIDTCEIYQVQVARDFNQQNEKSLCFDVSPLLKEVASGNIQSCEEWTAPVDSFIWYLEVKPT